MSNFIGGAIVLVMGLWGLFEWWREFGLVLRGSIPFALIIVGLLFIASQYKDMKS